MLLQEFVAKMNNIHLSVSDESAANLDTQWLTNYLLRLKLFPKTSTIVPYNNPLLELAHNYNVSKFELPSICFSSSVKEDDRYIYWGRCDGDDLVIEKSTDKIVCKEFCADYITWECADNAFKFLDAMYKMAQYVESCGGDDISENQIKVCQTALECALLAGGEAYLAFYATALGCEK